MTTYAVITPESESDSNYAQFEYMLGWFDFNGNWQQKLFTDWVNREAFENEVYNSDKSGFIGSINSEETNRVTLTVEDATFKDIKVYMSMNRAEKVLRLFKDGTSEVVAPDSNSFKYEQRGIRFQIEIDLIQTPRFEPIPTEASTSNSTAESEGGESSLL